MFSISIMTGAWAFKDYLCCVKCDSWEKQLGMQTGRRIAQLAVSQAWCQRALHRDGAACP